ncbi:cell adhesion molecule L1-like a isoform X4 [Osmerus eperlanus]|uniref:cell adhesion molecule L1-like a isoform X4 n=1 Tax=Osmerus eperlanus TaxID=29151 RepID=UPI002E13B712
MRLPWRLGLALLLALTSRATGQDIPLEVEQLPTITAQTSGSVIAFPVEDTFTMRCEAKGNPTPKYRWTKDGQDFDPSQDSRIKTEEDSGGFVLQGKYLTLFQGRYRCYAYNKLGTAMSEETQLIVPAVPKFPKEKLKPIEVVEGQPVVLKCDPPEGVPPRQIYWMSIGLQHIGQDERVSMGIDGNLYFSNAVEKDSRKDYCCFAAFSAIRTIVQKTAMSMIVKSLKPDGQLNDTEAGEAISTPGRIPSLLTPPGVQSEVHLVKGEELELECIAEGFPTPVVEWLKLGEKLPMRTNVKNYGKLLTIPGMAEEDEGKYVCKARNSVGEAVHYFDVLVEEPPSWLSGAPKSQLALIGEDVHIKCTATGKPKPAIVWRRNGQPLDDALITRSQVFEDTIVLHNARPEDSAVYQCEASNRHGTILANANIMVMNMPPVILSKGYQEYGAVRGGDVVLVCTVFGSPPPSISWKRLDTGAAVEGRERFSISQNGSLTINRAKKDDIGEYVCLATNTEGTSAITASVEVKEPTRIVQPPKDLEVLCGTNAKLECQVEYDITLMRDYKLVWTKDGKRVPVAFTEESRYFVDYGTLNIVNVNQSDEGRYTCTATTSLDQDTASATVTVLDVPDAPEDLELSERKTRSVRLTWVPGNEHNSSVSEFVVEYEENQWVPGKWRQLQRVPGNQATVVLELQGHLNYQFRLYAVNAIGEGPPSGPTERFKTFPAAPDKNPENIRIQGHLPHQMDISWDPLLPVEHNGPGLEYKLSYRRLGVEDGWREHLVKRHSFSVKDTPTFVPYEIKIQSRNSHGWGPEPKVVTGYSGEDVVFWHCLRDNVSVPTAAPRDVAVELVNTTLLRVSWSRVPQATVRGHMGGYNVHWTRRWSLLQPDRLQEEKYSLSFPGNRSHVLVPGLRPYSEYRLTVNVFNRKGNGPSSDPVTFQTPEGVPEQVPILTASNAQSDCITLVWAPPFQAHGILTGYLLQYQPVNETLDVGDLREVKISGSDTTQWLLRGLQGASLYRLHLSACTQEGCGPALSQEASTLTLALPALLNISSYVSDTFAKISWTTREEQQDSRLYVAYMNNREGSWRLSQAVNASKSFHVIEGLEPGTVYTIRLMVKSLLDNASIFEDVIQTRVKGSAGLQDTISTQGWFIGVMCAVAFLTLAALAACFVHRNKGGKYAGTPPPPLPDMPSSDPVKEKEDLNPDEESQGGNEDTCEYSDKEPLKGSLHSLGGGGGSEDSLVDYADGEGTFDEDGSFIGVYSGHKQRGSVDEADVEAPVST